MSSPRNPVPVAASVSEWTSHHSLTLAATPTQPKHASGDQSFPP
ncbi:MAG: hypothetical protein Q8N18_13900 [Opitutaceae bacterium]|nr:hypothetical protein [Opitutaceae bacterium]